MPYVLVGRVRSFKGRRLWEIVGRLKNFGVGRMAVRSRFERYPEPCFFRIVAAEPEMDNGRPHYDEDNMRGRILVDQIFRGRSLGVIDISKAAFKTDFRLIPKNEEYKYLDALANCKAPEPAILPKTVEMPPLLKIVAERDGHACTELKMTLKNRRNARIAEDGEEPTVDGTMGLGTPTSPQLYEGIL